MLRPALIFCLALAACGPSPASRAETGLADPAGRNCADHGGKLILRAANGGQMAWCELPGRTITAQEFYRETNP